MNKECTIYKTAIDVNTGEEYIVGVEKETTYVKNVKADEFIMVYLNDLSAMMKLNEAQLKLTMLL